MTEIAKRTASLLLDIGAVFLRPDSPFTWASGIKSPIYCDNRLVLTAPDARDYIEQAIADTIKSAYPNCEVLMGTATAGIAHAAIAAHILGLPMGYVRSGTKDHGRGRQIEGKLEPGQKVVIIEDLISTAGSVVEAATALREEKADVLGILSIFTYGMTKGIETLERERLTNVSLTNFDTLTETAAEKGMIKTEDIARLIAFRDNPSDESWMKGAH